MKTMRLQQGATLIELVISIVIIAITVTSAMMVVAGTTQRSADPMIRTQAASIANAYLEEILAQPLLEPSGADGGGAEAGETRATFDDVTDYNGLGDMLGAVDQFGNLITGLENYNVRVNVMATTFNADPALRIGVTVTHDGHASFSLALNAYRLN